MAAKRYTFDPHMHVRRIVVVGLGGTGSQLARSLVRILYDMQSRRLDTPDLHFVDPDVVEPKNVGRQLFAAADVGRYKAEVLARRLSAALGQPITFHTESFDRTRHISSYDASGTLIVGAVDNAAARRALAAVQSGLWLDCGNEYSSGQVIIGNTMEPIVVWNALRHQFDRPKLAALSETLDTNKLPHPSLVFPALLTTEATPQPALSCADLVERGEQHLLINDLIADVAAQYVYKLLHRQPINSFMTYVDADRLSMKSIPITVPDLEAYLGPEIKLKGA